MSTQRWSLLMQSRENTSSATWNVSWRRHSQTCHVCLLSNHMNCFCNRLEPGDPENLNVAWTTKQHAPITVVPRWNLEIKNSAGAREVALMHRICFLSVSVIVWVHCGGSTLSFSSVWSRVLNKIYQSRLSSGLEAISPESQCGPSVALISQLVNKSAPTVWPSSFEIQFTSRPPSRCALFLTSGDIKRAGQLRVWGCWTVAQAAWLTQGLVFDKLQHPPAPPNPHRLLCLTGKMSRNWSFVRQSQLVISFWPFNLKVPGDSTGNALRHLPSLKEWSKPFSQPDTSQSEGAVDLLRFSNEVRLSQFREKIVSVMFDLCLFVLTCHSIWILFERFLYLCSSCCSFKAR